MLKMIDPDDALDLVLDRAQRLPAETIAADAALGMVLAEDLRADRDYPPFVRAMMDGYAVKLHLAGKTVPVVATIAAGDPTTRILPPRACAEIMTGAPCPEGTEAVVKKEDVRREGDCVTLPSGIQNGQHIARRGSECRAGAVRAAAGTVVTPLVRSLAAAFGVTRLTTHRRPRLGIITTGSELVAQGAHVGPAQIRNSNGPMLQAMARAIGITDIRIEHARDTVLELETALEHVRDRDIIVLSGGVSAGRFDLVPDAVERMGATAVFHKTKQQPGKPILFAVHPQGLLFGLPGTPLGSHLGFHRYVAPAARTMMGQSPHVAWGHGELTHSLKARGQRTKFYLARATLREDTWMLTCLWGAGSSDLYAVADANAYIRIAPGEQEHRPGTPVPFQWAVGGHA